METIQQWIRKKVIEILGMEDDVLINYIYETLEESPVIKFFNLSIYYLIIYWNLINNNNLIIVGI